MAAPTNPHRKHGMHGTPTYQTWIEMRRRCRAQGRDNAPTYTERGIEVCDRWQDFACFFADMGLRPSLEHTIERLDGSRNYELDNCVWATPVQQSNNRTNNHRVTYRGERMTLIQAVRRAGNVVEKSAAWHRINRGWPIERAVETAPDIRYMSK